MNDSVVFPYALLTGRLQSSHRKEQGKNIMSSSHFLSCLQLGLLFMFIQSCSATLGYYRTYTVYGSGDNIISTFCAHGGPGPAHAWRKWNVECLDGEAVVGILDGSSDFQSISAVWCKFMFPYKPPTNGIYPYYPNCFTKNMTVQFFCYTPRFHEASVDTFITGFYDNDFAFNLYRMNADDIAPYKCCKAPTGYYIDYSSCYYNPTHDQYWEYYDAPAYFTVFCATGYVMTGLAKKINPFPPLDVPGIAPEYNLDWIQCCRTGFGTRPNLPPPPINYDYYFPSNTSSYGSAEDRPRPSPWSGGSARSLFSEHDGTLDSKPTLDDLTTTNGRVAVMFDSKDNNVR